MTTKQKKPLMFGGQVAYDEFLDEWWIKKEKKEQEKIIKETLDMLGNTYKLQEKTANALARWKKINGVD